jgi:hypothetical protein
VWTMNEHLTNTMACILHLTPKPSSVLYLLAGEFLSAHREELVPLLNVRNVHQEHLPRRVGPLLVPRQNSLQKGIVCKSALVPCMQLP